MNKKLSTLLSIAAVLAVPNTAHSLLGLYFSVTEDIADVSFVTDYRASSTDQQHQSGGAFKYKGPTTTFKVGYSLSSLAAQIDYSVIGIKNGGKIDRSSLGAVYTYSGYPLVNPFLALHLGTYNFSLPLNKQEILTQATGSVPFAGVTLGVRTDSLLGFSAYAFYRFDGGLKSPNVKFQTTFPSSHSNLETRQESVLSNSANNNKFTASTFGIGFSYGF